MYIRGNGLSHDAPDYGFGVELLELVISLADPHIDDGYAGGLADGFQNLVALGFALGVERLVLLLGVESVERRRPVATLVHQIQQPGRYSITWDAGGKASGAYFYRLKAGSFIDTKKLILIR